MFKIFLFSTVRKKHHNKRRNNKRKNLWAYFQKKPFADVLKNRCFQKFVTFTRKQFQWSFFFNKVAGHQPEALLKKRPQHSFFLSILKNILKISFSHLRATASIFFQCFQELIFRHIFEGAYAR